MSVNYNIVNYPINAIASELWQNQDVGQPFISIDTISGDGVIDNGSVPISMVIVPNQGYTVSCVDFSIGGNIPSGGYTFNEGGFEAPIEYGGTGALAAVGATFRSFELQDDENNAFPNGVAEIRMWDTGLPGAPGNTIKVLAFLENNYVVPSGDTNIVLDIDGDAQLFEGQGSSLFDLELNFLSNIIFPADPNPQSLPMYTDNSAFSMAIVGNVDSFIIDGVEITGSALIGVKIGAFYLDENDNYVCVGQLTLNAGNYQSFELIVHGVNEDGLGPVQGQEIILAVEYLGFTYLQTSVNYSGYNTNWMDFFDCSPVYIFDLEETGFQSPYLNLGSTTNDNPGGGCDSGYATGLSGTPVFNNYDLSDQLEVVAEYDLYNNLNDSWSVVDFQWQPEIGKAKMTFQGDEQVPINISRLTGPFFFIKGINDNVVSRWNFDLMSYGSKNMFSNEPCGHQYATGDYTPLVDIIGEGSFLGTGCYQYLPQNDIYTWLVTGFQNSPYGNWGNHGATFFSEAMFIVSMSSWQSGFDASQIFIPSSSYNEFNISSSTEIEPFNIGLVLSDSNINTNIFIPSSIGSFSDFSWSDFEDDDETNIENNLSLVNAASQNYSSFINNQVKVLVTGMKNALVTVNECVKINLKPIGNNPFVIQPESDSSFINIDLNF
tara:strand:+ start:12096 stop:14075 length:1980 start_codon:yes stop_codon:yes gene_type:complete